MTSRTIKELQEAVLLEASRVDALASEFRVMASQEDDERNKKVLGESIVLLSRASRKIGRAQGVLRYMHGLEDSND